MAVVFKTNIMPKELRSSRATQAELFRKHNLGSYFRHGFIKTPQPMLKSIIFKHEFAIRAYVLWFLLLEKFSLFPDQPAGKLSIQ